MRLVGMQLHKRERDGGMHVIGRHLAFDTISWQASYER
jgi:hypothetical protein